VGLADPAEPNRPRWSTGAVAVRSEVNRLRMKAPEMDPLVPRSRDYMGQADFTLRIAPIRRALLIDDDDEDQLREALKAAVAIWGGGRCPIVRVSSDGAANPADLQIAEVMKVDCAVDFRPQPAPSVCDLRLTVFPSQSLDDGRFWNPHPVAVRPEGIVLEISTVDANTATLDQLVGAGSYGLEEEIQIFRDSGYNVLATADPVSLGMAQLLERTAWGASLNQDFDSEVRNGFGSTIGFLVVSDDQPDFSQAVSFWNARALRPRRAAGPQPVSTLVSRTTAQDRRFLDAFAAAVRASSRSTPSFILVCPDDLRDTIATSIGADLSDVARYTEHLGSRHDPAEQLTYYFNLDPRQFWINERYSGRPAKQLVTLTRPSVTVSWPTPTTWTPNQVMSGHVHCLLRSPSIAGPRRPTVAELFVPNARWLGEDLCLNTLNLPEYNLSISLPTPAQILEASLRDRGLEYSISDKGQQISGLAKAHQSLALFRRQAAFEAVRALTGKAHRDIARELELWRSDGLATDDKLEEVTAQLLANRRPARTATEVRSQVREISPLLASQSGECLNELLNFGSAELGLVVSCGLCLLQEFTRLSDVAGPPVCTGCGSPAVFSSGQHGDPHVHFRLGSLLHTVSLNGGLVPLAAQSLLEDEGSYVVPGANLRRGETAVGEVDLLGWREDVMFAAEAKTSAGGFAATDIDIEARKLAASGADQIVFICGEELDQTIRQRMTSAATTAGVMIRILDASDLWVPAAEDK
jgi:hypothetical protein